MAWVKRIVRGKYKLTRIPLLGCKFIGQKGLCLLVDILQVVLKYSC